MALSAGWAAAFKISFSYSGSMNQTGWDYLTINVTTSKEEKSAACFQAGVVEGMLTHDRISMFYINTAAATNATFAPNTKYHNFLQEHLQFLETLTSAVPCDEYCEWLGCLMQQVKGIAHGYAANRSTDDLLLTESDIFFLNFMWDAMDIATAVASSEDLKMYERFPFLDPRQEDGDHCSALVRNTGDDLWMAHVSWNHFPSMLRQYKTYIFNGVTVVMSSYPGYVYSWDDWYMTSSGMAITETTISVPNSQLFHKFVKPQTVPEFLRCMIANYMALDAPAWVEQFGKYNSGTYCNQYMLLDMKLFKPNQPLPKDTFWVLEQLPGSITAHDKTSVLNTQAYWPSFNMAMDPDVRENSGTNARQEQYGSFFSATESPRARIFAREAPKVKGLAELKHLMRLNNYKTDPFSLIPNCSGTRTGNCTPPYSAMLAIAARGDLNPPGNASDYGPLFNGLTQRNHAGTDCKITSWSLMQNNTLTGVIISGPTTQDQPPFVWSKSPFASVTHLGHPDEFNFDWVDVSRPYTPRTPNPPADKPSSKTSIIIICVVFACGLIAVGGYYFYTKYHASGEASYTKV